LGLPPVCLCNCYKGKGPLLWEPAIHSLSQSLSSLIPLGLPTCSFSAERGCIEEGSLCPGHAGHEALSAIWTKGAGLGCWTSEQPTAELLLLWWPWGVSNEGWQIMEWVIWW
jgi:hypothetical protein